MFWGRRCFKPRRVRKFKFPDKLKTTLQLRGISGLSGEFVTIGSGGHALEEGCFAVVVVGGIGMEEAGGGHRRGRRSISAKALICSWVAKENFVTAASHCLK